MGKWRPAVKHKDQADLWRTLAGIARSVVGKDLVFSERPGPFAIDKRV